MNEQNVIGIVLLMVALFYGFTLIWLNFYASQVPFRPLVFILSIDAFRHDFIVRPEMKTLQSLALDSAYGPMISQFPSFTFTNHYSLMTGLYPVHHGIVGNRFFDADIGKDFHIKDAKVITQPYWWLAEPLWITANNHGLRTATLFWPGDEVWTHPLQQHLPYQKNKSYEERIEQVFRWIDVDPDLSMCTLYFSLIDDIGHRFGPESMEMDVAMERLEFYLGLLMQGLKARHLTDRINLIVLSDHGLRQAVEGSESNIYIDSYLPDLGKKIRWMDYNVMTTVFPLPGEDEAVYGMLQKATAENNLPMKVTWTRDLTEHYHFHPTSRIGPITIITEPGYTLAKINGKHYGGFHGYDPQMAEMNAFFLATGPSISARGLLETPAKSLDVYILLAELLGIEPLPNNGTRDLIDAIQ